MTATAAQHAAHLSAEQAAGDERDRWPEGLPLEAPDEPETDETHPEDPERTAA